MLEEQHGWHGAKVIEGHKRRREVMGKGEVDGFRTVECLRGRLLAERLASRAAREEAELMSKRLSELERLLAEEIKARNKAERRLKRLLKKLESLKIFDVSSQSNVSEGSGCSSSACFPGIPILEGEAEEKTSSLNKEPAQCYAEGKAKEAPQRFLFSGDMGDEASGSASPGSVNQSVSQEESWVSVKTAHSYNQSPKSVCSGQFNSESTRERTSDEKEPDRAQQEIEDVDDRLAIVPVRIWPEMEVATEPQQGTDVQSVLISLKHLKMQLQTSMGRRAALSAKELYGTTARSGSRRRFRRDRRQTEQRQQSAGSVQQPLGQPAQQAQRSFAGQCYRCDQLGHMARDCPLLPRAPQQQQIPVQQRQQAGSASRSRGRGRVTHLTRAEAEAAHLVEGTVSVFGFVARVLFDSGASHSFVSEEFLDSLGELSS
ncbi:hypothetical protein Taro_026350, partial [Colocasia esculenta]|nr:hypothetical protein [Colocasia esculenta]